MTVTIKMNTAAAKCNAEGIFSSNMRPNIYVLDKVSNVVKTGCAQEATGRAYRWYVVEYYGGYSFVTTQDLVK